MKKVFHFKSLTMRIWATFIIFIIIIVLAITLIYSTFIRQLEKNNQIQSLEFSHDTLYQILSQKQNPFDNGEPPRLGPNKIRPLAHLIVHIDSSSNIIRIDSLEKRFAKDSSSLQPLVTWFSSFFDLSLESTTTYTGIYDHTNYYFTISPLTSDSLDHIYLISYIEYIPNNDSIYFIMITGGIFIIIALFVSKIVSKYISKPLKQLESQALKIANKEWVEPLQTDSSDEIGSLIHSINFMQETLKTADQEERTFLQSISHDLKTPIMVIMSHAEAIKDGIYIDSLENTADIIKNEAARLETKVQQILYYNTLDYALANAQDNMVIDLSKLIKYMLKKLAPIRPEIDWQVSLKPVMVFGSSERLQVAIENILDNQIRYTESFIRIVLRMDDEYAILHISNNGPHIPAESLPHIFKGLYKGEKGKFGLGLAITHKIVTFYKGTIIIENDTTGVIFKIKIPLYKEIL